MGLRKKIKKFIYNRNIDSKYGKFATEKVIKKNWDKIFLNKIAFVNLAVLNVLKKKKNCFYLEIGCDNDVTFNSISLPKKYKYGVDPREGGNIKKTSDLFFKNNKKKFDVILLDGLHEYKQTQRDLLNSLKFLNNDGYIFIDDISHLPYLNNKKSSFYCEINNRETFNEILNIYYYNHQSFDLSFSFESSGLAIIKKKNNNKLNNSKKIKSRQHSFKNIIRKLFYSIKKI